MRCRNVVYRVPTFFIKKSWTFFYYFVSVICLNKNIIFARLKKMAKNIFNILIIMLLSLSVRGTGLSISDPSIPKASTIVDSDIADGLQEWVLDVADTSKKAVTKEPKKRSKKKDSKETATTTDSVAVENSQQVPPPPPPEGEPKPLRSAGGVSGIAPQQGLPPQVVGEAPAGMETSDSTLAANKQNGQASNAKNGKKKKKGSDKKVTFETFDVNYAKAVKYYNNGQYLSAARIFEELYPLSMGTSQADTILFLFADCYYKNKDFEMAAFHFKDYAKRYPGTDKAEYAYYLCVKSVFEISPVYSLDQSSTLYAIDEMDMFIKNYPHSEYVEDCNKMLDILNEKLAKKDFEILKLYYNTDHFQAVQIAAKNFLKEHPSSAYASESVFILIKSNLEYAKKSVQSKKRERFQACVDAFDIMQANFQNSLYYADAKKLATEAKDQISKLK